MDLVKNFVEQYDVYKDHAKVNLHSNVEYKSKKYPLVSIHFGNPKAPTLLIAGGVHGLERIGAQLSVSLLNSFHQRLSWDKVAQNFLESVQVVFVPLINPVGYFEATRSNAHGVDLMRNASVMSEEKTPFLLGGHRYSARLPWFQGEEVAKETEFIVSIVRDILKESNQLISLDIHSGFGFKDQIWFPFANSRNEFTQLVELYQFFELFQSSHPYHIYKIEPQSKNYLTHGDIWDFCYLNLKRPEQVYLPLTLEMGSWIWVKKNPLQLFTKAGLFNPMKQHRMDRTMRRHRPLFDFLVHGMVSSEVWTHIDEKMRDPIMTAARRKYYE